MSLGRLQNRFAALSTVVAVAAFTAVLSAPGEAEAGGPVQTWGKGTAGGALLGAEVVVIPMGAAGLNRGWPYFVFGGLALIIPAVIVSLNATAYRPPDSDRSEPASNEPSKEPPKATPAPAPDGIPAEAPPPGATSAYTYRSYRGRMAALPHIPTSLLDMYRGQVGVGLPAVQVRPLYTQAEVYKYGVAQGTEVQLPVFKAMF